MSDSPAGTKRKLAMHTARAIQIRRCRWKCLIRKPTRLFVALTTHPRARRSAGDVSFVRILARAKNSSVIMSLMVAPALRGGAALGMATLAMALAGHTRTRAGALY